MVKLSDPWFRGETVTSKDRGMKFGHGLLESPGRGIISGNQLDKWMGNSKMFFFEYSPRLFGRELYPMWLADMLPPSNYSQQPPTTTQHLPTTANNMNLPPSLPVKLQATKKLMLSGLESRVMDGFTLVGQRGSTRAYGRLGDDWNSMAGQPGHPEIRVEFSAKN